MGVGWIRTCVEKLPEAGWWDGAAISTFLQGQMITGEVVFPFYQDLITNVFLPNAQVLGLITMFGEGLIGLAILTGTFTNFALLNAIFMNLNFIMERKVRERAFRNAMIELGLLTLLILVVVISIAILRKYASKPI